MLEAGEEKEVRATGGNPIRRALRTGEGEPGAIGDCATYHRLSARFRQTRWIRSRRRAGRGGDVGAPGGIRTPDTRFRRPMLWSTELRARGGRHHTQSIGRIRGSPDGMGGVAATRPAAANSAGASSAFPDVASSPVPPGRAAPCSAPPPPRASSLAVPATAPRGDVLDIVSDRVGPGEPPPALEPSPATAAKRLRRPPAAVAAPPGPFSDPRRRYLAGPIEQAVTGARRPRPAARRDPDRLPVADRPSAHHAPVRPDAVGHVRRRRPAVPRRRRHRDVLRRPRPGRPRRHRARRGPPLRQADGLGRPPRARTSRRLDATTCGSSCRSWW